MMRVVHAWRIVGILALLALYASGRPTDSAAVETRTSAARALFSCVMGKTFTFKVVKDDREQMRPVVQSVLNRVVRRGAHRWLTYRLSAFDDESLVQLSKECGAMEHSTMRKELRLPKKLALEESLTVTFGLRISKDGRRASATSAGVSASKKSRSHHVVTARMGSRDLDMKKLQRTILQTICNTNASSNSLTKVVASQRQAGGCEGDDNMSKWFDRYDFDPNGPGETQTVLSSGTHFFQTFSLARLKSLATETTISVYGYNGHNDEADAFRHTYFSYRVTQELGPEDAKIWMDAHEISSPNPPSERMMDLHNNENGRRLATDPANAGRDPVEVVSESLRNGGGQTSVPNLCDPPPPKEPENNEKPKQPELEDEDYTPPYPDEDYYPEEDYYPDEDYELYEDPNPRDLVQDFEAYNGGSLGPVDDGPSGSIELGPLISEFGDELPEGWEDELDEWFNDQDHHDDQWEDETLEDFLDDLFDDDGYFDDDDYYDYSGHGVADPHMTGFDRSEFMFKGDTTHVFDVLSDQGFKLEARLMMTDTGRTYFNRFNVQSFESTVQVLAGTDREPAQVIAGDYRFTTNEEVRVGKSMRVQVERWGQEEVHVTIFTPKVVVEVTGHSTADFTLQHLNLDVEVTKRITKPDGVLGSTLPNFQGKPASEMSPKEMLEAFGSLPVE